MFLQHSWPIAPSLLAFLAIFRMVVPKPDPLRVSARVDRADLLLARDRFLNSNNATLVVSGGVPTTRAIRALRQLLGPWRKSEQVVPTTFRQPEPPDVRTLIINAPADQSAEVRLATRGVSRSDQDFASAVVLAIVARKRWETLSPELSRRPVFVRNEPHVLPGIFVMGAAVDTVAGWQDAQERARCAPIPGQRPSDCCGVGRSQR